MTRRTGPATESALVTLAVVVVAGVLLSVLNVTPPASLTAGDTTGAGGIIAGDGGATGEPGATTPLGDTATGGSGAAAPGAVGGGVAPGGVAPGGATSGGVTAGSAASGGTAGTKGTAGTAGTAGTTGTAATAGRSGGAGQPGVAAAPGRGIVAGAPGTAVGGTGGRQAGGAGGPSGAGALAQPPGVTCAAGSNGGATDVGVSPTSIKLASTVVDDGPGESFLGPVRIAMQAVTDKVNGAGGICGRTLELKLRNDSWDASLGNQYIQNFVQSDKVFALAVMPSSEGLRAADQFIAQQGVPVVGTDGMLIHQYRNPWIWPVATSTISTMHVMAKNAYDRGLRNFSIVFDAKYHFGVEGAFAFDQAVKRLTGNDIPGYDPSLNSCQQRFCGIQPGQSSYSSQAQAFNTDCYNKIGAQGGTACDYTAYLLEPDTALAWLSNGRGAVTAFGGAQPMFNRSFAAACGSSCDGMWVWSGYQPPLGSFAGQPAAAEYVQTVRAKDSSVDVENQFVEGGYVGMNLMVTALQQVGPSLTRARLKAVLDNLNYTSGLSQPLAWSQGNHFANVSAQAFQIDFKQSFNGFRNVSGYVPDPWVGQDVPAGG